MSDCECDCFDSTGGGSGGGGGGGGGDDCDCDCCGGACCLGFCDCCEDADKPTPRSGPNLDTYSGPPIVYTIDDSGETIIRTQPSPSHHISVPSAGDGDDFDHKTGATENGETSASKDDTTEDRKEHSRESGTGRAIADAIIEDWDDDDEEMLCHVCSQPIESGASYWKCVPSCDARIILCENCHTRTLPREIMAHFEHMIQRTGGVSGGVSAGEVNILAPVAIALALP